MSLASAASRRGLATKVTILALNSGSSSLKFGLYQVNEDEAEILISGEVEAIGNETARFEASDSAGVALVSESGGIRSEREAVARIEKLLRERACPRLGAIGHRIVHGGPKYVEHCLIDAAVLAGLKAAAVFAPLHTPPALCVIEFAQEHFPGVPQVACFDTAFHTSLPDVARTLPIAREYELEGVRRFGFHGLSCESIVRQLGSDLPERAVIAHLGNGASLTAVHRGRSIDTSMGLTPTGGVIMGTRSGDLDPGVLVYLARVKGLGAKQLEELVDHRSGLAGISGVSADMRRLHDAAPSNANAALAIRMFCYSVRKQLAAMTAALGGLDLLVFTGGIGENDAKVRAGICEGLAWAGLRLDPACNRSAANPLSASDSGTQILVLPSEEDAQIARHAARLSAHVAAY